jgi:HD-GYP domain-containing protein (c-di-GMP phosphodiesterase class II)
MGAFSILDQNILGMKLAQISMRELSFVHHAPCDIFTFHDDRFHLSIKKDTEINRDVLKGLILKGHWRFFVYYEARPLLIESQQQQLRNITRSLSIGDPLLKGKKQLNLLSLNLNFLYQDPSNDESLALQFQSIKNLVGFLDHNPKVQHRLYKSLLNQSFHFTLSQPLLSSMLLLSFLKQTYHFNEKEVENLFIASYFKDIGMALIPEETYDKKDLDKDEKIALSEHANNSVNILGGRLPLSPAYLDIIQDHHSHSLLDMENPKLASMDNITGIETLLVAAMDTIVAMTTARPYRQEKSLFEALAVVKAMMAKQYPQEFKFLVSFLQNFFGKM